MPEYAIVVVEPKFEGNVGAIARAMKNFGVTDMRLVNPCEIGDGAWQRSMHAEDVLNSRKEYKTLEEAVKDCSYVAGTSGATTEKEKAFVRINHMPWELADKLKAAEGRVALVFGRENWGLYNEELSLCDALVNIPTHPDYPIMNLSHAVAVLLYEMTRDTGVDTNPDIRLASGKERKAMYGFFDELLESINYPEHRREKTSTMFRRMLGRAVLTKWEFHTLSGVLKGSSRKIGRLESGNLLPMDKKEDWPEETEEQLD